MGRVARILTRVGNEIAFWAGAVLRQSAQVVGAGRPAAYCIDFDGLHRMDGHWALVFAGVGTIYLPPGKLRRLGAYLDTLSYLRVLARSRGCVGARTVRVLEAGASAIGESPIFVSCDYYGDSLQADGLYYPYVLHPRFYATGWHRGVVSRRSSVRRFRLFFSGAVNDSYKSSLVFPIMSRSEIVECLLDNFRSDVCLVSARADLANLGRTDRPIAVVLSRGPVAATGAHNLLSGSKYLQLLSQSWFALCPPGVHMPHSHNLIEAMAVGTVPVTNYAAYCRPQLADGCTCLAFSTPAELCQAVRRALDSNGAELALMQESVSRVYDESLSPEGFASRLRQFLSNSQSRLLLVNHEWSSARLWEAHRSAG